MSHQVAGDLHPFTLISFQFMQIICNHRSYNQVWPIIVVNYATRAAYNKIQLYTHYANIHIETN